jgi:hypothetical protein
MELMVQHGDTLFNKAELNLERLITTNINNIKKQRNTNSIPKEDSIRVAEGVKKRIEKIDDIFMEFAKDSIYYSSLIRSGQHKGKKEGGFYWLSDDMQILYMREKSKPKIETWQIKLEKKRLEMRMKSEDVLFVLRKRKHKKKR